MRHITIALALTTGLASRGSAQQDRYAQRLGHLRSVQSWRILTTAGIATIPGTFAGIANDTLFVRGEDGLRHRIPVDSLANDQQHRYLASFRNQSVISLPGAHQRRLRSEDYADYVYRRDSRRRDALVMRREISARKGPYRGWLAIQVPFHAGMPAGNFIQQGIVRQPPISFRTRAVSQLSEIEYVTRGHD